jgi:hypothetical protein
LRLKTDRKKDVMLETDEMRGESIYHKDAYTIVLSKPRQEKRERERERESDGGNVRRRD